MPEYELIGKAKLPRGFSYPLKRDALDAFLDTHGIDTITGVMYCGHSADGKVLSVLYYGKTRKHINPGASLAINAVPSQHRKSAESILLAEALPVLAAWLMQFSDQSTTRSQTNHEIRFLLEGDDLRVEEQ